MISHIFLSMLPFPSSHSHWTCLFPHFPLSCRLWPISPPIAPGSGPLQRCFVSSFGKPGLTKFMHLYLLFFFFCQKCVTCPFFQETLPVYWSCLAMTTQWSHSQLQNADYVVPCSSTSLGSTSSLQDILPVASSVSFVFTFSPFHHSHRIIISFLQTDNYTYHSYFHYHQQKEGLAHIRYSSRV